VGKGWPQDEASRGHRWRAFERQVLRANERALVGRMRRFFLEQRSAVLRKLAEVAGEKAFPAGMESAVLEGWDEWNAKLEKRARPLLDATMRDAGEQLAAQIGVTFSPTNPAYTTFLTEKIMKFAGDVNATTAEGIREAVLAGMQEGETVRQIADRVRDVFNTASRSRALTIARTETASAANGTRYIVMADEGIQKTQWLTARDEHVRDSHQACESEIRRIGDAFPNGLRWPHDLDSANPGEIINCRCTAEPVIEE
jgi:SPP1 gp7 family putative phage head morphogenesis protein